jgi:hypothetical protein
VEDSTEIRYYSIEVENTSEIKKYI